MVNGTKKSKSEAAGDVSRAVLYARVSSKEQEKEGFSIPAQLKELWVKLVFGRFESWRCIWLV